MSIKFKILKESINILSVTLFIGGIATCLLMNEYILQKPFVNRIFEDGEKIEMYHESKMQNFFSTATSGKEFRGDHIRTFPNNRRKFTDMNFKFKNNAVKMSNTRNCTKWAVVTTIFTPPQESVRRFLYRQDWCIVIVGDKSKPQDYFWESTMGQNMIFLSDEEQMEMKIDFVKLLPWHSFGRKNIGYLFAIVNGAKSIWDFDDDNILKFWIKNACPDTALEIDHFIDHLDDLPVVEPILKPNEKAYNPYPSLGAPDNPVWPRGFPIDLVQKPWDQQMSLPIVQSDAKRLGVLQSLADFQPDVDAIYRLTKKTPFLFKRPPIRKLQGSSTKETYHFSGHILQIPNNVLSPYNAQATLHFYDAFWALFLPITVHGRVSDIWRSYISQTLFPNLGLHLGFLPRPLVSQDRNPHSLTGDFEAELDLYLKSSTFIDSIVKKHRENHFQNLTNIPQALEDCYIDLYERNFLEIEDVKLIQLWIQALIDVGYDFPKFRKDNYFFDSYNTSYPEEENVPQNVIRFAKSGESLANISMKKLEQFASKNNNICPNVHDIKIGISDLHDGTRADLASTLSHIGQNPIMLGIKTSNDFGNYPQIKSMPGVVVHKKISSVLKKYNAHITPLPEEWIQNNYNYYKNDSLVNSIDGFVCTFPASMCQLWSPFKESGIIYLPAHRYNLGRCTAESWKELDKQLKILNRYKHNTIGAMSRYDMEYLRYYTGINPLMVPAYSGFYLNTIYSNKPKNSKNNNFLIFTCCGRDKRNRVDNFIQGVKEALKPELSADHVHEIYDFYQSNDLVNHPGVISLPYSVMSYRIVELYTMGIPLFIPSIKFFMNFTYNTLGIQKNGMGWDRTSTSKPYCNIDSNLEKKMRPGPEFGYSTHPYSPNLDYDIDPEAEMYWMQYADFYDWPFIQHFDTYQHLKQLLLKANLQEISENIKQEVNIKRLKVSRTWCDIMERVKS